MFEKEAEEYCGNLDESKTRDFIKDAFKDGAEFGYSKGFEFGVKSNEKVNQIMANEWHYVKDELPELYKDVLVVLSEGDCYVKRLTNHNEWVGRGSWCSLTDVIAWKEIVLPELKEDE